MGKSALLVHDMQLVKRKAVGKIDELEIGRLARFQRAGDDDQELRPSDPSLFR